MQMEISKIIIPWVFTPPREDKFQLHLNYFLNNQKFIKPIVVNSNGILLDGYIDYLIALRYGMKTVDVTVKEPGEKPEKEITQYEVKRTKNGKIKRKVYSKSVRKMIYDKAGKRCELCGKKILLSQMTLDHIVPLSMGAEDCVDNLQSTCFDCNQLKSNCLPESFMERITSIFMYQMEKSDNKLKLEIACKLIESVE